METLFQDVRYGFRTRLKSPAFATFEILSLALGIRANTAMFSIVDALMLRKLPVKEPGQLVLFGEGRDVGENHDIQRRLDLISEPALRAIRAEKQVFEDACGMMSMSLTPRPFMGGTTAHEPLHARLVTGYYFSLLGVRAALGRLFTDAEDAPRGAHAEIVLSQTYWKRRFGSKPGARSVGVLWMILLETFFLIGCGAIAGIPVATLCSRSIESMLYGSREADIFTSINAYVILVGIGMLAGLLLARRASHVDPMIALRYE